MKNVVHKLSSLKAEIRFKWKIISDTKPSLDFINSISSVAHELESHISSFASRVEQRRRLLELSVLFYSHTEEVSLAFDSDSKHLVLEFKFHS